MATLKQLVGWGGLLVIVLGGGLLFWLAWHGQLGAEILLPLLAITGIVFLLMALTLVAIVFAKVGLADKAQALALPEGSVRAVLALSLVVIFAIIAVYLYGSLAGGGGEPGELQVQTAGEARAIQQQAARADSSMEILSIIPPLDVTSDLEPGTTSDIGTSDLQSSDLSATSDLSPTTKSKKKQSASATSPKGPFTIRFRYLTNRQAADFAKQLLILIGTLVTSVSSFYFGTRAVESATKGTSSGGGPTISQTDPSQIDLKTSPDPIPVNITGSSLDQTMQVKLTQPGKAVTGTLIGSATASKVASTFPKASLTPGDWEVEVGNAKGVTARHPITII